MRPAGWHRGGVVHGIGQQGHRTQRQTCSALHQHQSDIQRGTPAECAQGADTGMGMVVVRIGWPVVVMLVGVIVGGHAAS